MVRSACSTAICTSNGSQAMAEASSSWRRCSAGTAANTRAAKPGDNALTPLRMCRVQPARHCGGSVAGVLMQRATASHLNVSRKPEASARLGATATTTYALFDTSGKSALQGSPTLDQSPTGSTLPSKPVDAVRQATSRGVVRPGLGCITAGPFAPVLDHSRYRATAARPLRTRLRST
jgi:hypothetical protein